MNASMVASGTAIKDDQASRAFPLAAITGHGTLKLALLLAAVTRSSALTSGRSRFLTKTAFLALQQ